MASDPIGSLINSIFSPPQRPAAPPAAPAPERVLVKPAKMAQDGYTPSNRRQDRYRIEADLVASRLYVVDKATGEVVDRYKTSPGTAAHPTRGDHFVIQRALDKAPWIPPDSDWAKDAQVAPGGLQNPMGIFKMDLGAHGQYIHGTPSGERKDLGHAASHGCLRMSNENVLQLFQRYAGVGTTVDINRDAAESARLRASAAAHGITDHAITDGAELLADAANGKAPKPLD